MKKLNHGLFWSCIINPPKKQNTKKSLSEQKEKKQTIISYLKLNLSLIYLNTREIWLTYCLKLWIH
jgi:hypothetical protein